MNNYQVCIVQIYDYDNNKRLINDTVYNFNLVKIKHLWGGLLAKEEISCEEPSSCGWINAKNDEVMKSSRWGEMKFQLIINNVP